jgi:hypothetical protein
MNDLNHHKESFSKAYLRALASAAGYMFGSVADDVDLDSIDCTISGRGRQGTIASPRLDIQLKCSADLVSTDPEWSFPLSVKNYDDLRLPNPMVPRILVLLAVPVLPSQWVIVTHQVTSVMHSARWLSLRDLPATNNLASVTVKLPIAQMLDANQLAAIMARIEGGGAP